MAAGDAPASNASDASSAVGAKGPMPPPAADPFARATRHLVFACAATVVGLGVAGSIDATTGGVVLLIGWLAAVASLHRLGRAGAARRER